MLKRMVSKSSTRAMGLRFLCKSSGSIVLQNIVKVSTLSATVHDGSLIGRSQSSTSGDVAVERFRSIFCASGVLNTFCAVERC